VRLLAEPRLPSRTSLLIYYPRAHYRAAYGTKLSAREWPPALGKEWAVRAWMRRPDAHSVLTLDEEAARRWSTRRGAGAHWLPEPPVPELEGRAPSERRGCALYGALAPRKGLDLLVGALAREPTPLRLVLAGAADPGYETAIERHAARLLASGLDVDLRAYPHSEQEGLRVLAAASCAVLPYPRHAGMSRVLLEACSVGTPVVAHRFGLLGHLVQAHGLGLAADCTNPRELRSAVLTLSDPIRAAAYSEALTLFKARYTRERFSAALLEALGLEQPPGDRPNPSPRPDDGLLRRRRRLRRR
jgi:hypothetical protein